MFSPLIGKEIRLMFWVQKGRDTVGGECKDLSCLCRTTLRNSIDIIVTLEVFCRWLAIVKRKGATVFWLRQDAAVEISDVERSILLFSLSTALSNRAVFNSFYADIQLFFPSELQIELTSQPHFGKVKMLPEKQI